ncbi:MFS transporter [Mucilaginibacter mali]|uniref:MFS transporter n=1 Tax=Mucilaginibacter mali TaxID=2740462 RepID=A0A7D4Q6U7_9SPHI|nr:MFS transporter [Mucilaginibacter mali]QKJ28865.1 MFS transporter [Mucilaginibacter mali]
MEDKNNKKTIWAWCMFDWANQSYNMVITSTIFPAYYVGITANTVYGKNTVSFFGHKFVNTVLQNYVLAASYLLIVVLLPILTSIADYRGAKKLYLQLFTWLGSLACAGLFFMKEGGPIEFGMICFGLATIGYCGGFVFYNSYLPQIATLDKQNDVSAKGFIYGFAGSIVVQLVCLVGVLFHDTFGITEDMGARISFVIVFLWWIGFAIIPFRILPKGEPNAGSHKFNVLTGGFKELAKVLGKIKEMPLVKRFLPAFFFYSVGVQTIMLVAAEFAAKELHMKDDDLITIILVIQVVAIIGAWLTSLASNKWGNTKALIVLVVFWTITCLCVYFIANQSQFYVAAFAVGLVMGGVQSLSRSTYAKLLPENIPDTASYFSFYDATEKLSIVVGLAVFAYVEDHTSTMRNSALALDVFFVIGLLLLIVLQVAESRKKKEAALNAD